jgi:hypothetical protein
VEVAYFPDAFIAPPLTSNPDSKVTGFAEKIGLFFFMYIFDEISCRYLGEWP